MRRVACKRGEVCTVEGLQGQNVQHHGCCWLPAAKVPIEVIVIRHDCCPINVQLSDTCLVESRAPRPAIVMGMLQSERMSQLVKHEKEPGRSWRIRKIIGKAIAVDPNIAGSARVRKGVVCRSREKGARPLRG